MIYVDNAVYPFRGRLWCHLAADTLLELHQAADILGVRRWFQQPPKASWPHYDLAPSRRAHALKLGAREIERFELLYRAAVLKLEWASLHASPENIIICEVRRASTFRLFIDDAFSLSAR